MSSVCGDVQRQTVVEPILKEAQRQGVGGFRIGDCIRPDVIYIPHGLGNEELGFVRDGRQYLLRTKGVLAPGPYYFKQARDFHPENTRNKFKMIGWPKSDKLFSPDVSKMAERIRKELNLTFDKTVLWADDFLVLPLEKHGYPVPYRHEALRKTISLTEKMSVNLIIKPHLWDRIFDPRKEDYRLHVRWIDPNTHPDVTTLFLVSDVLYSDNHSSVATEFMVSGKPVITFQHPTGPNYISAYAYDGKEFPLNEFPATNFDLKNWGHLEKLIETCVAGEDGLGKLRKKHVERIIYKPDGHASERAVKAIKELM